MTSSWLQRKSIKSSLYPVYANVCALIASNWDLGRAQMQPQLFFSSMAPLHWESKEDIRATGTDCVQGRGCKHRRDSCREVRKGS